MDIKKVLFISQEISPYLPDSPLSLLGRELPQFLQENGVEVRTFMPKYGLINERRNQLHDVIRISGMNIVINDADHPLTIKVATLQPTRLQVYFIYNDDYFAHTVVHDLETVERKADNDERSIFFARGVIETVRKLRWDPAVIQCIGWITALAPVYMRRAYADDPSFRDAKIVYSLHENDFTEPLDAHLAEKMEQDGIDPDVLAPLRDKPVDHIALTRLALQHCDGVMQCSPTVKPEVLALVEEAGLPLLTYDQQYPDGKRADNLRQIYHDFYNSL